MALPPILFASAWLSQRMMTRKARRERPAPAVAKVAGVAVGAASVALAVGTFAQYQVSGTTVDPSHPDRSSKLITTGPNRLTRNPIYLGFAGLLAAHALWRGSASALIPAAGFVAAVTPQIEAEEDALISRFGRDYASYVKRVPRWLGRLG